MQTDPNWSNFLYNPKTDQLELIDFGASREYTKEFMDNWYMLLSAAVREDREACVEYSLKLGYLTGQENEEMLSAHVRSLTFLGVPFRSSTPQPFSFTSQTITDEIRALIPVMLRHRLTPPPQETYSLNRFSGYRLPNKDSNFEVEKTGVVFSTFASESAAGTSAVAASWGSTWPHDFSSSYPYPEIALVRIITVILRAKAKTLIWKKQLMGSTTPKDTPDITSDTSIPQIILRLSESGCPDLTSRIDIPRCSQWSVTGGGHGDIYEGWLTNGDHVAIKTARGDESLDLSKGHIAFKRVARELYTWHKLSHQNIANLLGMGTFRGHIAMISPWIAPGDFYKFIDKFPGTDRMDLCIQVANGLTYLHKNKVVFGDLKAQNILIGHDGVAKLTDFGLSVLSEATCAFSTTHTTGAGSTRWMAPELLSDIPVNQSYESDIYALAMTFIEILTGAFPFPGLHDTAVMFRVVFKQAIPGRPEILEAQSLHHDSWWELLQRCWDRTPDRRPKASDWLALDERTAARQVNMDRPIITSSTTIPEIISLLSQSGCPDITNQLNLELCSQWSVDGGGQSDIYRGALLGGEQVAIKTTRKDPSLDFSKGNISFK
ncbi:hypothetical protein FRC09_014306, partial [Ceratobasidium sp. 395]